MASAVDEGPTFQACLYAKTEPELNAAVALLGAAPLRCTLRGNAHEAAVVVHSGAGTGEAAACCSSFDVAAYLAALPTSRLGRTLLTSAELPSTQALLQENRGAIVDGTVCVADSQSSGKGRGGNVWTSPPGCLMFSLAANLALPGTTLPFVQYAVCIALVEAVQQAAEAAAQVPLQAALLRIKWPNDLYSAGGLKVGGILCNSAYKDGAFNVTVGVGLNVSNSQPTTCLDDLLRDAVPTGVARPAPLPRETLLAAVMGRLEARLGQLREGGFGAMRGTYLQQWMHSGQKVTLEEADDATGGVRRVALTVSGLTDGGYLLALDETGQRFELHPDGNSFDFFQGLVRKKVQ